MKYSPTFIEQVEMPPLLIAVRRHKVRLQRVWERFYRGLDA